MKVPERRQMARVSLRTPLRFRALGVASDKSEHFTEAMNISRGGFYFASCNEPYGDGRIGFGAEIEKFQNVSAHERWVS